ncbi:O-acetyl-ADP-ribose deacetylase [Candidatus Magnetaquicoccus inordinatus]|uniref:O-acetyl-ADP-ribose deacetylase n=1 Tax=Candidatus Magnetaquicoccus inordinatus TaxID=2496818 RepID=UPI00102C37F9|nr:O-acetyl-ADP-ribose deacetylase [Candidatus Magnetaquicoccus inordinatus]
MNQLTTLTADITQLTRDAIVNAANASLLGGSGVDGAIHRAGGPAILEACQEIRRTLYPQGLPPGEAVVTTGGNLPSALVIHTAGPIYDSDPDPHGHLASCYRRCLELALAQNAKTIAFPGISTGVYGFPKEAAAQIAIATIRSFFAQHPDANMQVTLVAFSATDEQILQQHLP